MYRLLSLLRLAELIVDGSDHAALAEFHNHRSIFRWNGQSLKLVEFLDRLQQGDRVWEWCGRNSLTVDKAYDLTLSKFSHIPTEQKDSPVSIDISDTLVKKAGPDCRYYFKAFVTHASEKITDKKFTSEIDREMQAARLLKNLVMRHFYLSCLECQRRSQNLLTLYAWQVNGQTLSIWMPTCLTPKQRRDWLKTNIEDPDPSRQQERERIQTIINQRLMLGKMIPLDENITSDKNTAAKPLLSFSVLHDISVQGLARVVAKEKADNIKMQRPSIQTLGKAKLARMIHQIFEDLSCDDYDEKRIANRFGLSLSTFSRFAGSRWSDDPNRLQTASIPDLWFNTAQTLAGHSTFIEAARAVDVWSNVEKIARSDNRALRSVTHHD